MSTGLWLGILGSSLAAGGDFESIATVTVGSGGAANIEFTSIPSTYQHLQVRLISRANFSFAGGLSLYIRLNSDSGSNYRWHRLHGDGASVVAAAAAAADDRMEFWKSVADTSTASSVFGAQIVDILDYGSTSKATTARAFNGYDANGIGTVSIQSGLWTSTNAVSTITLTSDGNWLQHTTAALYGVKAP
jgi:hypothetical protein